MTGVALATVVAGGLGAALRFLVDGWVERGVHAPVPLGTVVLNVTGSFALGLATAALAGDPTEGRLDDGDAAARAVLGAGLLAGYTTFSTASTQNADLLAHGRPLAALAYGGATYAGALLAAAAGLWAGSVLR
ncbi:CrcB protein [Cellulosimicrobium cellulans J34]|nr:CrcB protein [Cellulosimicrobium cellulans J34]